MTSEAYAHCEALVRTADKDRFLASLFAPAGERPDLFALYAFDVEIARVRDVAREAVAGEIRLQWWRDALTGNGHGDVDGASGRERVAGHAGAAAGRGAAAARPDRRAALRSLRRADGDSGDLEAYMRATSSALMLTAARILGADDDPQLAQAADAAGLALALPVLLNVMSRHAARGQVYLPQDVLARHDAPVNDILAGHDNVELHAALAEMRGQAGSTIKLFLPVSGRCPPPPGRRFCRLRWRRNCSRAWRGRLRSVHADRGATMAAAARATARRLVRLSQ